MAKHFRLTIRDDAFTFAQDDRAIAAEAALDGLYVLRTSLPAEQSDAAGDGIVRRVSAAEIEAAVVDQVRALLR